MSRWKVGLIFLILISSCVVVHGLWYTWLPNMYYYSIELPRIKSEIAKVPGVAFQGVEDYSTSDERPGAIITLHIQGKGLLKLYKPTHSSFVGGGWLVVYGIGKCAKANLAVTSGRSLYPDLSFTTASELIQNYDRIYERVREKDLCFQWQ